MPRSIQELQKRVFELQKQNRCQAVKIWHLEEEKMDLVGKLREVESLSRSKEAESNQGRRVCFGGVHFSNSTGGNSNASVVEEFETILERETHIQEREVPDVLLARQQHKEFMTEGRESESMVRGSISEEVGTDLPVGEKIASSSPEVEEGDVGLDMHEKGGNLLQVKDFTIAGAGQGLVTKEGQKEENLGKGLMVNPLPLKSVGEVASIDGESDLEKFRRDLRGRVGSAGNRVLSKALKKQVGVEERFQSKKRRLASQGKLEEGDKVKVAWGGRFYSCKVVKTRQFALKVHYMGWGAEFDEWVPFPGNKVKLDT